MREVRKGDENGEREKGMEKLSRTLMVLGTRAHAKAMKASSGQDVPALLFGTYESKDVTFAIVIFCI